MADSQTISAQCPSCQARYELAADDAGQTVECVCSCQFTVPGLSTGISIACPACAARYELDAELAGQQVECQCGERFIVSDTADPQSTEAAATIRVVCPQCAAQYGLSADDLGTTVECVCGFQFEVSQDGTADPEPPPVASTADEPLPVSAPPPDIAADAVSAVAATPPLSEFPDQGTADSRPAASRPDHATPSRPKTRRQKKMSPAVLGIGTAVCAVAAGLTVFFVMTGNPDKPAADTVSDRSVAASTGTATQTTTSTPAIPAEATADTEGATSDSGTETTTPAAPSDSDATLAKTGEPGAENPNALTDQKDFVIGALSPGSATSPASLPPATATTEPASPKTSAADTTAPDTTAAQPEPVTPVRRLEFVPPERTYRRFGEAFEAAVKQFTATTKLKTTSGNSDAERAAWEAALAGAGGLFKSAVRQINKDADPQQVMRARLLLTYCYLQAGQFYEAGILGHAIARWTPDDMVIGPDAASRTKPEKEKTGPKTDRPTTAGEAILAAENNNPGAAATNVTEPAGDAPLRPALEAAGLALAAFVQAREIAPADDREAEFRAILEIATLYDTRWPQHEKADSIRLFVGQLFQSRDDPTGAAEWYARVSRDSSDFARSRLMAGQACWTASLSAANRTAPEATTAGSESSITPTVVEDPDAPPESEQPAPDTRLRDLSPTHLKQRARDFLTAGIAAGSGRPELSDNLAVARLTLAQMYLAERDFEQTVVALTTGEPTVIEQIGEGAENRPARGTRSIGFARIAYTTLIRARLGGGQLDQASAAMSTLTDIAGGTDAASLAKLHLDLSEEMTRSYRDLAASGGADEELLKIIAKSFEQLSVNASGLSPATLLRAATAATDLAESVRPPADPGALFGQAAVLYEALLQRGLPDPGSETAVRFRLADVLKRSGQFEQSLALYDKLLAAQPNVFSAQMKAAQALQALGTSSQDSQALVHAITGSPQKPHLWGWGRISTTLQRLLAKDPARDDYRERFLEARLHIAECRIAYAGSISDSKKKKSELEKALRELATLAYTTKSYDAPGWQSLNEIYQTLQKSLGRKPQPLYTVVE